MQPSPQFLPAISRWLMICLTLIALMVALGGVTRLTESGLSIVEWKLVSGTLPPLSDEAWGQEFGQYQQSPQFTKVNKNFSLADFKQIFWLEYLHRLLGRIIGLAVVLPLIYFAARRALPRPLLKRMVAVAILVGMQGTVGWIMVASGLHDEPRVEPFKLALHLLLAFSVFMLLLWTRWQIEDVQRGTAARSVAIATRAVLGLLTVQIFFGALVAGLRAGHAYPTYPLMDGQLVPEGLHLLQPWWINHVESVLTVQFQHRMGALAVVGSVFALVGIAYSTATPALRRALHGVLAVVFLQFILGVATLLSGVNIALASLHQLAALLLMALLVRAVHLTPLEPSQVAHQKSM